MRAVEMCRAFAYGGVCVTQEAKLKPVSVNSPVTVTRHLLGIATEVG
jgi:hypothetical protein